MKVRIAQFDDEDSEWMENFILDDRRASAEKFVLILLNYII